MTRDMKNPRRTGHPDGDPNEVAAEAPTGKRTAQPDAALAAERQPESGPNRRLRYAISWNRKNKNHRHWSRKWYEDWDALVADHQQLADDLQPNKFASGGLVGGWLRPGPARTPCPEMPCDLIHKTADTVAWRSFLDLDFDGHDPDLPERVGRLGVDAIVYWTSGATVDHQKWRVKIRTDRDMWPDEYEAAAYAIQEEIVPGQDGWDGDSHNYARTMYRPASACPDDFRFVVIEGKPLDVDAALLTAEVMGIEPHRPSAREPVERPDVDLSAPATPEECGRAEALLERFLHAIRESRLPGDGQPGNCHNTWLGREGPAVGTSGALIYMFAAGGCLDWDRTTERIIQAAEDAGWEMPETAARVEGAMVIGKERPARPYLPVERDEVEEVFEVIDEQDEQDEQDDWADLGLTREVEDGPTLFAEVEQTFRRYLYLPNETDYLVLTLWAAATWAVLMFENATRLIVKAPEKECGKTRVLDVLQPLTARPMLCGGSTAAALVRSIVAKRPTVLLDEYDVTFGTKKAAEANEEIRGVINNGHSQGVPYLKVEKGAKGKMVVKEFDVFAMIALAGIGNPPDTVASRGVVVDIARRPKGVKVQDFRKIRDGQQILKPLGARIGAWVESKVEDGSITRDTVAENMGVEDRAADNWEPLLIIADTIGGEWPARARAAAAGKTADQKNDVVDSDSHNVLRDLRRVWPAGATRAHSSDLVDRLKDLEDAPWARYDYGRGLNQDLLSRLLRGYGIRTKFAKVNKFAARAYFLDDPCHKAGCKHEDDGADCDLSRGLKQVWASYLPDDDEDPAASAKIIEAQRVFTEAGPMVEVSA